MKLTRHFRFLDELYFKPTPAGWLFAVPFAWPKRTYLVTDEQKAALTKPLRQMMLIQMLIGMAAASLVPGLLNEEPPLVQWLAVGGVCIVIILGSMVHVAIAFRPRLAGLAETSQRITFADRFKRQATTYPKAMITTLLLCSVVLFAGDLALGMTESWDLSTAIGAVLFGLTTLHAVALLVTRMRLSARPSP